MRTRCLSVLVVAALLWPLAGCYSGEMADMAAPPSPASQPELQKVAQVSGTEERTHTSVPSRRMIVQTVELRLIVKDADTALDSVRRLVTEQSGYITTSRTWKQDGQPSCRVTIRVPADKLDATLVQLRALAMDVDSESVSGEDVTEEYVDLQASLRNEQAYERELLELLTETRRRTGDPEHLLAIYNRINEVRARIEKMQGRAQYLEKMSAMATISLELVPSALAQPIQIAGWHPTGTVRTSIRALLRALQVLVDLAIVVLIVVLPVVLIVGLPALALLRLLRRRRAEKRLQAAEQS